MGQFVIAENCLPVTRPGGSGVRRVSLAGRAKGGVGAGLRKPIVNLEAGVLRSWQKLKEKVITAFTC